ncbi:MAG: AAA family ATPase, partial [Clostridia bacterium]|nr:AAA family ATPase [Clostridia bacterium]
DMIILNADQAAADKKISDWFFNGTRQVFVLTGYAGTGKTALLKHTVLNTLGLDDLVSAAFVTPTGKAATVLIKNGVTACTVHRLIYQSQTTEQEVEINGKKIKVERLIFRRRESIDKAIKLIVLDEASMVSDDVLGDILNFGVKVLLCGDNAQLPPVEGFNTFLQTPDHTLTQIVRQQLDNPIIQLSQLAREGKPIPFGNYGDKAFVLYGRKFEGERRKKLLLRSDQIICGLNRTRAKINDEMRAAHGFEGLPKSGEKLICTYNNWEQFIDGEMRFNLVNGIIGTAIDPFYDVGSGMGFTQFKPDFLDENCPEALPFDIGIFENGEYRYNHGDTFAKFDENGEATGVFTLNRFEYGYCISCHKAQGSEFDNVIIFDESFAFREDKNRWLYTALTRARKKLILVR